MREKLLNALSAWQNDRRLPRYRRYLRTGVLAILRTVFIVGFAFVILYPVLAMISKAFMSQGDLYDNTVLWIPRHFTLDNIKFAIEGMDYWKAMINSTWIALLLTVIQTLICWWFLPSSCRLSS